MVSAIQTTAGKHWGELYSRVSKTFHWLFLNHPEAVKARDYLESRGISRLSCEAFRIGWAPSDGEWLYGFLREKKYSPEFLASSGLFSRKSPRWAFFADRLMFPVMPDSDRVVAFSGRSLGERGPKYKNSPETVLYRKSQHLYGLGQARKDIRSTKRVYLCEGNIDVLSCRQSGVGETVAPLGTAFTNEQARMLKRLSENIVLVFDGDEAGTRGAMRASIIAEEHGLTVQAVQLPPGSDPAEIMERKGSKTLQKILSEPINIFEYLVNYMLDAESDVSGEAQEEALKKLRPYLHAVGSEVRREAYLKQLAEAINANPQTVIREYYNRSHEQQKRHVITRNAAQRRVDLEPVGDELYLMIAAAVKTECFSEIRALLAPEVFRDKRALAVYRVMDELSAGGALPRTDMIVEKLADPRLAELILEKSSTEEFTEKVEETIEAKIKLIRVRTLAEESRELINVLSDESSHTRTKARMLRIKEIDQEIISIRQGDDD